MALFYLGIFSENKGAKEILELRERLQCKLYIYGDNVYGGKSSEDIIIKPRVNAEIVSEELERLSKHHRFIGLSLIKPVHFSYATQEANKDIDYMCLGVPFIGNKRIPTYEKILKGCGVMFYDFQGINRLVYDQEYYNHISEDARISYYLHYSSDIFRRVLLESVTCKKDTDELPLAVTSIL